LKKFFKILLISLLSLVVILTATVYVLSSKLKDIVLTELNKELAVEGSFESIHVTFWKTFPRISIQIDKLGLKESTAMLNKPLLESEVLYLQFSLLDIMKGNYELEKVLISNAKIRMAQVGDVFNYKIFHDKNDSLQPSAFSLDLKGIELKNVLYEYYDLKDSVTISYDFDKVTASGKIGDDITKFKLNAKGICNLFVVNADTIPINKYTSINARFNFLNESQTLEIFEAKLLIDKSTFDVSGAMVFDNKDSMNLLVVSESNKIQDISGLLPNAISSHIQDFNSKGEFSFRANIFGTFANNNNPSVEASMRITDGSLIPYNGALPMEDLNFNGKLWWSQKKSYLQVAVFSFKMAEHKFTSSFDLNDFAKPYVSGSAKGTLDLGHLDVFLDLDKIKLSGILNCDLQVETLLSDFESGKFIKDKGVNGTISWSNLSFSTTLPKLNYWNIDDCEAKWLMKGNMMSVQNMKGKLNQSPFALNLSLDKFLPYFMGNASSEIIADFQVDKLLLPDFWFEDDGAEEGADLTQIFPENLSVDLKFKTGYFKANKFELKNLNTELVLLPNKIEIAKLNAAIADGTVNMSAILSPRSENLIYANVDLETKNIKIAELMKLMDNFGQDELTHENISGRLNMQTQVVVLLNADGTFSKENLYAFTDLTILEGQLKNYEPMQGLSKHAEITELNNIRFSKLQNTFEIREGEINFPFMDIGNNVLNLKIKGKHSFDNYMDYSVRVRLSEVLATKYKIRSKKDRDDFEDLGDKGIALFISITGYPDNLKFKFEKVAGRPVFLPETVSEDIKNAKKEFKESLQQEFSAEKRQERKQKEAEKEKVEWDEW
jgi:hypothetical protein